MQAKLEHVRRLLAEGYTLDEVDEDGRTLNATFRRPGKRVVVRFLPSEAQALLLARGPLRLD